MLLGLIIDKIKTIRKNSELSQESSPVKFQRKNSLRKYTLRKNSGIPVSELFF